MDPRTVLRRRPSPAVEWVEVAGEVVAWNDDTQSLHLLDPIAALVFQLCDGRASIERTATELAEVYRRDAAEILHDVCTFAGRLRDLGIVEAVG